MRNSYFPLGKSHPPLPHRQNRDKVRCNIRSFDNFINQFRNKPDLVRMNLRNGTGYWKTNGETAMHFNAIHRLVSPAQKWIETNIREMN